MSAHFLVNRFARDQGGTGVSPVTTRQHGRDARAPWKNRAKPRFYCLSYCIVTAYTNRPKLMSISPCLTQVRPAGPAGR